MRRYKDFSTVMSSSMEFLRASRIIKEPMAKIKIIVINHHLKEDRFNNSKSYHLSKTEKKAPVSPLFSHRCS